MRPWWIRARFSISICSRSECSLFYPGCSCAGIRASSPGVEEPMLRDAERQKLFTRRMTLLAGGKLALFSLLAGRMYYLQVLESDRYRTLADENRINLRLLPPPRGRIVDRDGEPLAVHERNFRVLVTPEQAGDLEGPPD